MNMGQNVFCDLCHKTLPNVEALQPLKFGDVTVAELCLTCSSAIKTGIQQKLAEARAAFTAAIQTPAPPAPPGPIAPADSQAPPEVPPQAQTSTPG